MKKFFPVLLLAVFLLNLMPALAIDAPVNLPQVAEKARHNVQFALNQIDISLASAAKAIALVKTDSPDSHGILKNLSSSFTGGVDAVIISPKGIVKVVEPKAYAKLLGADFSRQPHIQKVMQTKKPVMSNLFEAVQGIKAVAFERPLYRHSGQFEGSIGLLIKPDLFLGDIFSQLSQELKFKALM